MPAVSGARRDADSPGMSLQSTVFAAARSRAQGPTTALWHAVELHRPPAEIDEACELTLCGSLARISTEQVWPVPARDVCPACLVLSRG